MKDFQKIDWKQYNRPPFYQQWLCRDDTLKLVTFGDTGLSEIDDQILALKDQWDLDNVEGHFLDRVGKLLDEKRNGNTDEYYRILLKLRRLLNTSDGSIPSIIKAIKFFYSSEIVHIVPDYPAGLIIEHDGEGTPGLNFNKLLAEIIAAGVSFSTKELFAFKDIFVVTDFMKTITMRRKMSDTFHIGGLKFNGRAKHDGHTLNPTEYLPIKADGSYKFNGTKKHKPELAPAQTFVAIPIKARNGIIDKLKIKMNVEDHVDLFRAHLKHNGMIKADGQNKFNGYAKIGDVLSVRARMNFIDREQMTENLNVRLINDFVEKAPTRWKFDGTFKHNGAITASATHDKLTIAVKSLDFTEQVHMSDNFTIGMRYFHKHDGKYKADGEIKFNSSILIPL
jgi:hypothetical protein